MNVCMAAARRCATASDSRPASPARRARWICLLCNVLVIDPVIGIVKGDLGIKDGRIVGLGKAGNPAIMDGVDPRLHRLGGNDGARLRRA